MLADSQESDLARFIHGFGFGSVSARITWDPNAQHETPSNANRPILTAAPDTRTRLSIAGLPLGGQQRLSTRGKYVSFMTSLSVLQL